MKVAIMIIITFSVGIINYQGEVGFYYFFVF